MNNTRTIRSLADRLQQAIATGTARLAVAALELGIERCARGEPAPAALTVERAALPSAPERLAAVVPGDAAARAATRELYERCLQRYRCVQRPQDLALDNAGAALACFVAASLQALHGVTPDAAMLARLEHQLDAVARLTSGWESASTAQRQFFFEKIAIFAVLIADSWRTARGQAGPALAPVRGTARAYLKQLLGVDPDLLVLDAAGLSLRPRRPARRAA